jgi:cytochrome c oxidase subunit 3
MATLTEPHIGAPPPLDPGKYTGGGGGDDSGRPDRDKPRSHAVLGVVVLMIASMMTFGAMFCALIVRRMSSDWHKVPLPHILWWNTGILLLSSIVIDIARRRLRRNRRRDFNILWTAGAAMGTWFLIGQIIAWFQLEGDGFHLFGNPGSAFFYILTWTHAAHVIGALAAVYYVEFLGLRYELGPNRRGWVNASSLFWHFLDVLWLGIMGLFAFQA